MRCYYTGDECECGNSSLDDQCPHDDHPESDDDFFDPFCDHTKNEVEEALGIERRDLETMERLDAR